MRKISLMISFLLSFMVMYPQVPAGFSYQAVVRNSSGEILTDQSVNFRFSILSDSESGSAVYVETQSATSSSIGLVNLVVGQGTSESGVFNPTGWGMAAHYLKVEMDPAGGSSFLHLGTNQLMSVPYAFHAQTVETDQVDDADADNTNELQTLTKSGNMITLSNGGGSVTDEVNDGDWDATNEIQYLEVSGGNITLSKGGGTITDQVNDADADPNNEFQTLSLRGTNLTLSDGGGTITLPSSPGDDWGTQTIQTDASLDGNGTTGSLLKLAQQGATSGQVLKWNGSSWLPGDDIAGSSFWQQNSSNIYYNAGNIAIGTNIAPYELTINSVGNGIIGVKGTLDALLYLDKGATNHYSAISFRDQQVDKFWLGMLQNNNLRISTSYNSLQGIEVTSGGDVNLSGNLNMPESKKIGIGVPNNNYSLEIMGGDYSYQKFYHTSSGTGSGNGFLIGLQATNNVFWMWNFEKGPINIGTNNLSRMSIEENGNVGIGTTNPDFKLDVAGQLNLNKGIANDQALFVNSKEALWSNGTYFSWGFGLNFNYFARPIGIATTNLSTYELVVNGQAAKSGGGSWSVYSDIRLKNIVCDYGRGLEDIMQLHPVKFRYKEDNPLHLPSGDEQVGFIAQEVQEVFPEAVSKEGNGYLDFNMHTVNVALVNAVKELKTENDQLKAENQAILKRLEKLESLIASFAHLQE